MSRLTTLLLDGPGAGQIAALEDDRSSFELFSREGRIARYQVHRFLLGDQEYLVSAVDERNASAPDVAEKIRQAKHTPRGGPNASMRRDQQPAQTDE